MLVFLLAVVAAINPRSQSTLEVNVKGEADWSNCANEFGNCATAYPNNLFRFGTGNTWFYEISSNISIPCHTWEFGDPAPGVAKKCQVSKLKVADKAWQWPDSWTRVANYNQAYIIPNNCTKWARWGGPDGQWFYKLYRGTIWCNEKYFSNPAKGTAAWCEVGNNCLKLGKPQLCASNGLDCEMDQSATAFYLMEFALDEPLSLIRFASMPKAKCDKFQASREISPKSCYYYKSIPNVQFGKATGYWEKLAGGQKISASLTQGIERSAGVEKTQAWGAELGVALTAGYEFAGAKVEVTATATASTESSNTYTNENMMKTEKTCTAECNSPSFIYQWRMGIKELCGLNDFNCTTTIETCFWACRKDQTEPACPQFRCCDANCNTCKNATTGVCPKKQ